MTEKKRRTYNSYINRYPFFISLYKTLHIKRMDADQHCGVLVKTYNIFKMQKLMFIGDGILCIEYDVKKIYPTTPSSLELIVHESFILPSKEEGIM